MVHLPGSTDWPSMRGVAMRRHQLLMRGAIVALSAAALAACATPQYAARPGYTPPPPAATVATTPPPAYNPPPQPAYVARRPAPPRYAVEGRVVEGDGVFFEYQVSRGEHVDQLARDYHTTRRVIVEANHLKPPYG